MKKVVIITIICLGLFMGACGKKGQQGKSMEQIQKEEGIPVRVVTVTEDSFSEELTYNAVLGGSSDSFGISMLADVVAGVHAKVGDRVSAGQVIVAAPAIWRRFDFGS